MQSTCLGLLGGWLCHDSVISGSESPVAVLWSQCNRLLLLWQCAFITPCLCWHPAYWVDWFCGVLVLLLGFLASTVVSYAYIISTIFWIPSTQDRQEAFVTCASHFTVVSLGFGIFVYARPSQVTSLHVNKILSVFSSIVTSLLNPFIFSLRNEQMKDALRNALHKGLVMPKRAGNPRASWWLLLSQSLKNVSRIFAFVWIN